jgi:hypothetical protein
VYSIRGFSNNHLKSPFECGSTGYCRCGQPRDESDAKNGCLTIYLPELRTAVTEKNDSTADFSILPYRGTSQQPVSWS